MTKIECGDKTSSLTKVNGAGEIFNSIYISMDTHAPTSRALKQCNEQWRKANNTCTSRDEADEDHA